MRAHKRNVPGQEQDTKVYGYQHKSTRNAGGES
jgi:hypothetical protein